jgi:hypothetical protein
MAKDTSWFPFPVRGEIGATVDERMGSGGAQDERAEGSRNKTPLRLVYGYRT